MKFKVKGGTCKEHLCELKWNTEYVSRCDTKVSPVVDIFIFINVKNIYSIFILLPLLNKICSFYYRPQTTFAKVMFLHVCVCPQREGMHGRGACIEGGCAWQGGVPGFGACMAGGHVWQGGACMARGRHPCPSRYYGIRSMSRRYASYWNAFLLQ